ncbi:ComF family protein [Desulfovibrio ferrophilus]|nr:ComF family protein [Desulfovibrio ferrophilus]
MSGVRGAVLSLLGSRCQACGAAVAWQADAHLRICLCPDCHSRLLPRQGGYCPLCGEMVVDATAAPLVCGQCRRDPPPWSNLAFYGPYEGLLRELLTGFKFNNRLGLGRLLQALSVEAYHLHGGFQEQPDAVVPVPLHARRLVARGFNQSLEMGRLLAHEMLIPLKPGVLARRRHTPPQAGLPARERRQNVHNAFWADEVAIQGRRILLVDDIMTTGGTMRECARTLQRSGAADVSVLVIARTTSGG